MTKLVPFGQRPARFERREADPRDSVTIHGFTLDLPADGPIRGMVDVENREGVRREVEIVAPLGGKNR